jgi:hypothetical protein
MLTISQARKLLPEGFNPSDEELASAIADWYALANIAMDQFLQRRNSQERKEGKHERE